MCHFKITNRYRNKPQCSTKSNGITLRRCIAETNNSHGCIERKFLEKLMTKQTNMAAQLRYFALQLLWCADKQVTRQSAVQGIKGTRIIPVPYVLKCMLVWYAYSGYV